MAESLWRLSHPSTPTIGAMAAVPAMAESLWRFSGSRRCWNPKAAAVPAMAESLWRSADASKFLRELKPQFPRWQRVCGGNARRRMIGARYRRSSRDGREFVADEIGLEIIRVLGRRSSRDGREFVADPRMRCIARARWPQFPRWQRVCGGPRDALLGHHALLAAVPAMAESLWRTDATATLRNLFQGRSSRDGREFVAV